MSEKKYKISKPIPIKNEIKHYYDGYFDEIENITKNLPNEINNFLEELVENTDDTEKEVNEKIDNFTCHITNSNIRDQFINIHLQYIPIIKVLKDKAKTYNIAYIKYITKIVKKLKKEFDELENIIPKNFLEMTELAMQLSYNSASKEYKDISKKRSLNIFESPQNNELITYVEIDKEFNKIFDRYCLNFK